MHGLCDFTHLFYVVGVLRIYRVVAIVTIETYLMWNWIYQWWKEGRSGRDARGAHMTFAKTTMGNRIQRTGVILRRQLWLWPILAVFLLSLIGYLITRSIRLTMESNLQSQLTTLLDVEKAMVLKWLSQQETSAKTLANNSSFREHVEKLVSVQVGKGPVGNGQVAGVETAGNVLQLQDEISQIVAPTLANYEFAGYMITDAKHQVIASNHAMLLGQKVEEWEEDLGKVFDNRNIVTAPFASIVPLSDKLGQMHSGVPTMFVSVPVYNGDLQVIAALSLRIRPEREFTRLVQLGRIGRSGETYAVDRDGLMVSNSRFDDDLILLGILQDREGTESILQVQLRDPGGDMTRGYRPKLRRGELGYTKAAAALIEKKDGINITGYRDYRGVPVVGVWTWLGNYDFGLVTEIDYDEAFEPLNILRRAFYTMFGLLSLSALAIFIFTLIVTRLQKEARQAAVEAKQLGQYRLEEKLGEGAMGTVYRGHHSMLRRQSAIKLLNVERVNETSISRFEQEVQITCNLNNPHTIAIYDYGRTPEGVFYYAMEYLDGINLQDLVDRFGPLSDGRVAKILDQLCSSLFEAHSMGLVHRDIKPANVMLNRRGGVPDFVKLLDFGLVRAVDEAKRGKGSEGMAGTPLYMSPESIQTPDLVDARSDLYAVGAVGYFLLTGAPVFQATSFGDLCQQHVDAIPVSPSVRSGRSVSEDLEYAIMACLEKNRAKRPQTARDLANLLHRIAASDQWTIQDADAWWSRYERGVGVTGATLPASTGQTTSRSAIGQSTASRDAMSGETKILPATGGTSDKQRFDQTMDYGGAFTTRVDGDFASGEDKGDAPKV
jgi:serine/threonine protein kinase